MARRNRRTVRRIQRSKATLPARVQQAFDQLFTDATDALIYMSSDNRGR